MATVVSLELRLTILPPAKAALGKVTVRFWEEFSSMDSVAGVREIVPPEFTCTVCVAEV